MRKLFVAALLVFGLASSAPAALVLHVEDKTVNASTSAQTVQLNVYLEETEGTQAGVSTYDIVLRLNPSGPLDFVDRQASTSTHPPLFFDDGPRPSNGTNLSGDPYEFPKDFYLFDDYAFENEDGVEVTAEAPVQNNVRDGLFSVIINIPANTLGSFDVTVEQASDLPSVGDVNGVNYPLVIDHGTINVVPIPEPSAMALGLLALPLIARRRR